MRVILTKVTTAPIQAIEQAASNCYDSTPTPDGKIAKDCYKSGHHAMLEFADFTFHVEGVSRSLLAQITRHRMASFAVRSQRYCNEENADFVVPPTIMNNEAAKQKYHHFLAEIKNVYKELQQYGVPNEDARYVLPNACTTTLEVKMNGRELIHFVNERLCNRAQWEIRTLAQEMKKAVIEYDDPECKIFAQFLVPKCEKNIGYPFCTERKSCGKHPKLKDIYNKKE